MDDDIFDISLVQAKQLITDDYELTEIFNNHYLKSKKLSEQKSRNIADTTETDDDRQIARLILDKYKDQPCVHPISLL